MTGPTSCNGPILGDFRLGPQIGEGGMGAVFLAEHARAGVRAAIKSISPRWAAEPGYRERLAREVNMVAQMRHPSVVAVYDFGLAPLDFEHPKIGPGTPWLAMQHAEAGHLGQLRTDVSDWDSLRAVLEEILIALAHVHSRGMIHRDLKPENVLVSHAEGFRRLLLTDFGISHPMAERQPDVTREISGVVAGTPAYMAPEQIRGKWRAGGPWTDLYSLGCMAFEIACGRLPFTGPNLMTVLIQHLSAPRPPVDARFAVPKGFEAWLHRLMDPLIYRRFERAADALHALRSLGDVSEPPEEIPVLEVDVGAPTLTVADSLTTIARIRVADVPAPGSPIADDELLIRFSADDVPPFPANWRESERERAQGAPIVGAGLVGLREWPVVGLDDEMDTMWELLRRVVERREPVVAVVRAPVGGGKSSFVRRFVRRAHELGVASALELPCRSGSWSDVLARVIQTKVNAHGLPPERIMRHVARMIRDLTPSPRSWDLATLARLALGDGEFDLPLARFGTSTERNTAFLRFVRLYAHIRPVVVTLDDADQNRAAASLALQAASAEDFPALFVVTADDGSSGGPREGTRLVEMLTGSGATVVRLPAPSEADCVALVEATTPLDRAEATTVAQSARGSAEWIAAALTRWARTGETIDHRASLDELWGTELAELHTGFGTTGAAALAVAAALGDRFDESHWSRACGIRGLRGVDGVAAELLRRGHIRQSSSWLVFERRRLREAIRQMASSTAEWASANRACAELFRDTTDWAARELRVSFLLEAEANAEALSAGLEIIDYRRKTADPDALEYPIGLCRRALAALGVSDDDIRWARVMAAAASRAHLAGDLEQAVEICNLVIQSGSARDARVAVDVAVTRAAVDYARGKISTAVRRLRDAIAVARSVNTADAELARAERNLGAVLHHLGTLDEAAVHLRNAVAIYERLGDDPHLGWSLLILGNVLLAARDVEAALPAYERAQGALERSGTATALGHLHLARAQYARHCGDRVAAAEHVRLSVDLFRSSGSPWATSARMTLALHAFEDRDFEALRKPLPDMIGRARASRRNVVLGHALMLAAGLAVHDEDWDAFDRHFEEASQLWWETRRANEGSLELPRLVAEDLEAHGQVERAARVRGLVKGLDEFRATHQAVQHVDDGTTE